MDFSMLDWSAVAHFMWGTVVPLAIVALLFFAAARVRGLWKAEAVEQGQVAADAKYRALIGVLDELVRAAEQHLKDKPGSERYAWVFGILRKAFPDVAAGPLAQPLIESAVARLNKEQRAEQAATAGALVDKLAAVVDRLGDKVPVKAHSRSRSSKAIAAEQSDAGVLPIVPDAARAADQEKALAEEPETADEKQPVLSETDAPPPTAQ